VWRVAKSPSSRWNLGVIAVGADELVEGFASEVGAEGPVAVVGGRTQWSVGGEASDGTRLVRAPSGIIEHEPAELTVKIYAGTTLGELDAVLAPHGQMVPLDAPRPDEATVGGVLAVGHSGPRRRKYGHIRELLLQVTYVNAKGETIVAGGPTVKNVSGYDLGAMLVGSLGTLGLVASVIVRCVPRPELSQWYVSTGDPRPLSDSLYEPSSILWDGATTWVLLEGHRDDVGAQAAEFSLEPVESGPALPDSGRESLPPRSLFDLTGTFVAELGVGIVHRNESTERRAGTVNRLHHELKANLDPMGRLNPGRIPF